MLTPSKDSVSHMENVSPNERHSTLYDEARHLPGHSYPRHRKAASHVVRLAQQRASHCRRVRSAREFNLVNFAPTEELSSRQSSWKRRDRGIRRLVRGRLHAQGAVDGSRPRPNYCTVPYRSVGSTIVQGRWDGKGRIKCGENGTHNLMSTSLSTG